ncbi:MAG: HEPN domain-containing protein [Candidatus Kapabacteria bacterium]|jgi:HEPN domain-containing protein|nr:HEPN domain-containing protein [Candidatus Kapabacteria bacterium]
MDKKEKIEYWLELAEDDFITTEIVLKSKRYLHFGFLCHLTIEKLLKAYFWKNVSAEPPYTHSLLVLSAKSGLNDILEDRFKQLLYKLMPMNIEARYPSNKKEIYKVLTPEYCNELFDETKELFEWMKKLLVS